MTMVMVTRPVSADEERNYLGRDVNEGETFYVFKSTTYGCVNTLTGIALSEYGEVAYPFFEFPRDAVTEFQLEVAA